MVDANRSRLNIQEVEQTHTRMINDSNTEMQLKLDQVTASLAELKSLFTQQPLNQLGSSMINNIERTQYGSRLNTQVFVGIPQTQSFPSQTHYSTRFSKVEFLRFDGMKVKEWLYKCKQFFALDNTPPKSKVRLASNHLDDSAL
ncbi:hypothetical protein GYH30_044549 [Glycine max]|nr:hypothetical protein GYH30_044549 [Glycine max]